MGDWKHILFGRSKKGNVMAGLVALMGEKRYWRRDLVGNLKEGDHWESPSMDGRIIRQ
jgi:hypothetical protein